MASNEGVFSVGVALDDSGWKRTRVAHVSADAEEVAVDKPSLLLLEDRVEYFQDLSSYNLIISIHYEKDLKRLAKLLSSPSQVRHRPHLPLIPYYLIPLRWYFLLALQKVLDLLASSIC